MLGLNPEQQEKLLLLLERSDLYEIANGEKGFEPGVWRGVLGALLADHRDFVRDAFFRLAGRCGKEIGRIVEGDEVAERAPEQLIELAAMIAASSATGQTEDLVSLLLGVAFSWPATASILRRFTEQCLTITPARDADALWRLRLELGSMP